MLLISLKCLVCEYRYLVRYCVSDHVPGEIELDQVLVVAQQRLHLLHHLLHTRLKLGEAFTESQKPSEVVGCRVLVCRILLTPTQRSNYLGDLLQKHIKGRLDDLQVPIQMQLMLFFLARIGGSKRKFTC